MCAILNTTYYIVTPICLRDDITKLSKVEVDSGRTKRPKYKGGFEVLFVPCRSVSSAKRCLEEKNEVLLNRSQRLFPGRSLKHKGNRTFEEYP